MSYRVGDRVLVVRDIDLQPHTTVRAGEEGTVVSVEPGLTNIQMDEQHWGLDGWDNCIWIIPVEFGGVTDDIEDALELIPVKQRQSREEHAWRSVLSRGLACWLRLNAMEQLPS